jgi:hypothetical protein
MRVLILAVALCAAAPCQALTLKWNATRTDVTLSGDINGGDAERIINAISASSAPPHYLHLDSKGGDLAEARQLVLFVRAYGFMTVAESVCASACFAVWFAGKRRFVQPTSRIGIHAASAFNTATGRWVQNAESSVATAGVVALYRKLSVPAYLISQMAQTPPSQMYYLTSDDMLTCGAEILP